MTQNVTKGIILAFLTATISGLSIFYNKLVLIKGIDPFSFNIIKNGGVAVLFSVIILFSSKRKELFLLDRGRWLKLWAIAIIGGSIPFILYFQGLTKLSAVNANIIHKSMFIWVALMAIPILGEKLNIYQVIGYSLVAVSNLFIGGFSGFSGGSGEVMILAATLLWAVENIIAKITLKDIDVLIVAWGRMFFGVIIIVAVALFQNKLILITKLNSSQMTPVLVSIVFLTSYVYVWFKGLKEAPATLVTSILVLATPITNLLSAIFISHNLTGKQLGTTMIMILGVFLIAFFFPKRSNISPLTNK